MGRKKRKRPQHDNGPSGDHDVGPPQVLSGSSRGRPSSSDTWDTRPSLPTSNWFSGGVNWISRRRIDAGDNSCDNAKMPSVPPATTSQNSILLIELNKIKNDLMPAAQRASSEKAADKEFRWARSICNPFECLGHTYDPKKHAKSSRKRRRSGLSQFVNRSAIKLANIDALLGFTLTTACCPRRGGGAAASPLVFADLCGAPGGFSEYIFYRLKHPVKVAIEEIDRDRLKHAVSETAPDVAGLHLELGRQNRDARAFPRSSEEAASSCLGFGMSLSGSNDDGKGVAWNMEHLKEYHLDKSHGRCQYVFQTTSGDDGTGSIYTWKNTLSLLKLISTTLGEKAPRDGLANLVVADGGFDAQRDSNCQESLAHKIVVCQTAAALSLLRVGGTFVLKMFGFRETRTRRMLSYLYECFEKMAFVKPVLSRPASAERYLICYGYEGTGAKFEGSKWRDQMLATMDGTLYRKHTPLETLMDSFDQEMLMLNIDTCKSIIEYLEVKERGEVLHSRSNLDTRVYESAWKLR